MTWHRVHMNNECPRLGSGWRLVTVRMQGKMAILTCPFTYTTGKVALTVWRGIEANGEVVCPSVKVLQILNKNQAHARKVAKVRRKTAAKNLHTEVSWAS